MKTHVPVAIPPGTKLLHMRYEPETRTWLLWIHHDARIEYGTFLRLEPEGGIESVTIRPDGTEDKFRVK